jgi:copper transport protein
VLRRGRRCAALGVAVVLAALALAPAAGAHAVLQWSRPAAAARLAAAPARVSLTFSEPVLLLRGADLALVDARGRTLAAARRPAGGGATATLSLSVGRRLPAGAYGVRYRVLSDDGHVAAATLPFAVGPGHAFAGAVAGPAAGSTGAAAVLARFLELLGLGGMLAVLAFRWLVWRPACNDAALGARERAAVVAWGSERLWTAFWAVALAAVATESYVLLSETAAAFGSSPVSPLARPADLSTMLQDTRYGAVFEARGALVAVLLVGALWVFAGEARGRRVERAAPTALLALVAAYVLGTLSYQGHAAQAVLGPLSVLDDAVHLSAVSVWIGGLALLALVVGAAPRAVPDGGAAVARAALVRFSRVASVAVVTAMASGLLRSLAELDAPGQLASSAYGRTIAVKLALLVPVLVLAARNRRLVAGADLGAVVRGARLELALSLAIVLAAAVLVGQAPARLR